MVVPGSSNQRDRLRRSTSSPPSSPEKKSQLGKLRDRLLKPRGVSARPQESFSNAEIEMSSLNSALEQCLAEESLRSSRGKAPEKCIADKIDFNDLNTPITECSKMVRQYRTFGKEVNRAANTRNEEKRMYKYLHEEGQGDTQVVKCLRKTIQELEEEIMETIEKRNALEEELRALSLEESDHR